MFADTPIVECKYGWGRVLRLYHDGVELEGVFYALSELERVYPTYHRVLWFSSARLELQFRRHCLTIPGIADVLLAHKIVDYMTRVDALIETEAIEVEAVREACTPIAFKRVPEPRAVSQPPAVEYFWEYDANDMPTSVEAIPAIPASPYAGLPFQSAWQASRSAWPTHTAAHALPAVEPWPAMLDGERVYRLKRLQAERELRIYGFDVQALSQRLNNGPLPLVLAPLRLLAGETAHYSIEANLCVDASPSAPRERRQVKDRGKLVLTNKRFIYLGRNRQVVLEYEKILQVACLPGAVALDIEHVPQRQFFAMRRPLECSFYLKRLLERDEGPHPRQMGPGQALLPASVLRPPAVPPDMSYQQLHSTRARETLKLSLDQLCSTPTTGGAGDMLDTWSPTKPSGRSL